jgi:F-type H+-transporting ATPase subunit epsilon
LHAVVTGLGCAVGDDPKACSGPDPNRIQIGTTLVVLFVCYAVYLLFVPSNAAECEGPEIVATFQFDFVGPERTLYSGQVEAVQLPGSEGEMTVLPGHAPVITSLKVGVITVTEHSGTGKRIYVQGGFADIGPKAVTVLAERAAPIEEISPATIDQEIEAAEMARDATQDPAKREELNSQIVQLREAKFTLSL